jgi:hypothetical protein
MFSKWQVVGLSHFVRPHKVSKIVEIQIMQQSKTRKEVCPALDNYGQSCFVRSDLKKVKCVWKTQMMPPSDHEVKLSTVAYHAT